MQQVSGATRPDHQTVDLVTTGDDKNTIQNLLTINLHWSDHMSGLIHQDLKD